MGIMSGAQERRENSLIDPPISNQSDERASRMEHSLYSCSEGHRDACARPRHGRPSEAVHVLRSIMAATIESHEVGQTRRPRVEQRIEISYVARFRQVLHRPCAHYRSDDHLHENNSS